MVNHSIEEDINLSNKSNDSELVEEPWKVYIAQSVKTLRFYTGIAINPLRRLNEHNSGNGSKFARDQGPLKIVYTSKPFSSKSEARKREVQIKGWRSEKKKWLVDGLIT